HVQWNGVVAGVLTGERLAGCAVEEHLLPRQPVIRADAPAQLAVPGARRTGWFASTPAPSLTQSERGMKVPRPSPSEVGERQGRG
ncbi:MAG: hypothetical protein Q8O07_06530, partial [Chloroflexota bacterium]|nr:hypothetical protein [Chloroflexota bacterium]